MCYSNAGTQAYPGAYARSGVQPKDANEDWSQQPPATTAPVDPSVDAPADSTGAMTGATPNLGIPGQRQWTHIPYLQSYGGQPAPYADSGAQMLDIMRIGNGGAGRFAGNAAARYGFAPFSGWRPDTLTGGYTPPYYGPRYPGASTGATGQNSASAGLLGANPGQVTPKVATSDPMAGFRQLLAEDPRAASEALNFNPAWMMQNMAGLNQAVGGDFNAWRSGNQPMSSNAAPLTDAQRALIRQRMGW